MGVAAEARFAGERHGAVGAEDRFDAYPPRGPGADHFGHHRRPRPGAAHGVAVGHGDEVSVDEDRVAQVAQSGAVEVGGDHRFELDDLSGVHRAQLDRVDFTDFFHAFLL